MFNMIIATEHLLLGQICLYEWSLLYIIKENLFMFINTLCRNIFLKK